jgi:hypothetical protein
MNTRWFNNFVAICIVFILLIVAVMLAGCGSVKVKQSPDGTFEFSSKTLWKDIESAEFESGDFDGSLGSSTSADDARSLAALCILFPQSDACQE